MIKFKGKTKNDRDPACFKLENVIYTTVKTCYFTGKSKANFEKSNI